PGAEDAAGEVGGTGAAGFRVAQELFDDPVLEGGEADHRQPAAGLRGFARRRKRILQRGELVVDGDPKRLEDALRRVAVTEARGRRNRGLDRVDELSRPLERLLAPPPHDRAGDLLRVPLLAVGA